VESPINVGKTDRALIKANLVLNKTIPKDFEHTDEIKYLDEVYNDVKYLLMIFSN
jgi:hypothetical protein